MSSNSWGGGTFSQFTRRVVQAKYFDPIIIIVVLLNCVVIALQTMQWSEEITFLLDVIDNCCLAIYVIEIVFRIVADGKNFFKQGWCWFDLIIVTLSLIPLSVFPFPAQAMRLIRVFRAMRAFLLVSAFKPLRIIVESIFKSLPSVAWTIFLLIVIFYIYAVAGIYLFGEGYPEYFADLPSAFFTLFQLSTMESWSSVAREALSMHPLTAFYFISFILISAYIVLNVVVGIIVAALEEATTREDIMSENPHMILRVELNQLHEQIEKVNYLLAHSDLPKAVDGMEYASKEENGQSL